VEEYIKIGISDLNKGSYAMEDDNYAAIRYHLVRGLEYIVDQDVSHLLKIAQKDPHKDIRAFAEEIIQRRSEE
jgi:hypothetical protein